MFPPVSAGQWRFRNRLRGRALIQKTILASLNRAKDTIERIETAGVVGWRVRQAARARCQ
jgi:hypothetical protein